MEPLLDYRIPVLHPLVVHFPLALLLAAALAALLWAIRGTPFWRRCLLFLLLLATVGALLAYATGDPMEEQSEGTPMVDLFVALHERLGLLTLLVSLAGLAGVAALSYRQERRSPPAADPLAARIVLAIVVFAAAILVAWTSHIGGVMVWGVPR